MQNITRFLRRCAFGVIIAHSCSSLAAEFSIYAEMPAFNNDGLSLDAEGNLYVSHVGSLPSLRGKTINRVTPDGTVTAIVTGLLGPVGSDFDSSGNMYISNFNTGTINKVTPDGVKSVFSVVGSVGSGGGIAINSQDEIFLASWGENTIYKFSRNGVSEVWVQHGEFDGTLGLTIDDDGNLYVGNFNNGRIFKIDNNKTVTPIGTVPDLAFDRFVLGYVTYANNFIYATGWNANNIYKFSISGGNAILVEGSEDANLNNPNGITASADGSTLFVSEFGGNRIIKIDLNSNNSSGPPVSSAPPSSDGGGSFGISLLILLLIKVLASGYKE